MNLYEKNTHDFLYCQYIDHCRANNTYIYLFDIKYLYILLGNIYIHVL